MIARAKDTICDKLVIGKPPPPFLIVQRRPRVVVNAYSTGRTPMIWYIRYDMVY